ncbi:MAG TPA: VWA domain-containing protein [Chitinophagaceae bacterium]|nr:VWA domain-containing protein [Chitinophagaceae bacterium]
MQLLKVKINLPNNVPIETEVEESMFVNSIIDDLKDKKCLDKNKYYGVKTISGTFIPGNVNFREYGESEIKIIELPVPISDFGGEVAENGSTRCLLVLVVDTSYSMLKPIVEVNRGLQLLADEIKKDATARQRIEIAIITFNSLIEVVQEPSLVDKFIMPVLSVQGSTKMVDAVRTAINYVESRKKWYRDQSLNYYRPHILLITDGEPDTDQDIIGLADEIKKGGREMHFVFMPVGVVGADKSIMQQISQPDYPPLPLEGYEFVKLFKWLSNSMKSISKSKPGESVKLDKPDWVGTGWEGEIV